MGTTQVMMLQVYPQYLYNVHQGEVENQELMF